MSAKTKRSFSIISTVPDALGFDDADLKANRAGVLSERQRRRFHGRRNMMGMLAGMCAVGVVVCFLIFFIANNTRAPRNMMGLSMMGGILSATVLIIAGYQYMKLHGDASDEIVYNVSGVVRRKKERRRKNREDSPEIYFIYMDDLPFRFQVDDDVYDAFANRGLRGGYYTLYYLPRSRTILSAEPLENPFSEGVESENSVVDAEN